MKIIKSIIVATMFLFSINTFNAVKEAQINNPINDIIVWTSKAFESVGVERLSIIKYKNNPTELMISCIEEIKKRERMSLEMLEEGEMLVQKYELDYQKIFEYTGYDFSYGNV